MIVAAIAILRILGQCQHIVLQAETVNFHARDDHRLRLLLIQATASATASASTAGSLAAVPSSETNGDAGHDVDHVSRQFDVDGPFGPGRGIEHAIDLAERDRWIGQLGSRDADFLEHFRLRAEIAHLVVQERIVDPFVHPGRTGDHDDGRFLGIRAGNRIAQAQSADTIGHTNRPHSADPCVGIGGKAGESSRVQPTTLIGLLSSML